MEYIFENTLGQSILCGVIFFIAAVIMYLFPPKKINNLYGYRTAASMHSKEQWDFAQKYSSLQMMKAGAFLIAISFAGKLYPLENIWQTALSIALIVAAVIYMLFTTEKAIKTRFPKT